MSIGLPQLFEDKLLGLDKEQGIVHSALASFGEWFEVTGTPLFFPDYTDHGPRHITNVLATAVGMIPGDANKSFSPGDVTVFVLATLLHDSPLYLSDLGFRHLILGDARERRIAPLDESSWPDLWDEFLFTARRWDDRRQAAVFGNELVQQGLTVTDPFVRWGNLTLADRKLIGEFIRDHHPRLAHEFAVFGVPGVAPDSLTLPPQVSAERRDLSGVIARSHGISLRTCLDYVAEKFQERDYQGIHAIYLMALLRLADYLQIDASRAPGVVFRYRVLPSRTSDLEWRAHNAVKNITPQTEDPESVEIRAEPPDVETYLRVRKWLDGIQSELDTSWAVLGEIYGRYPELSVLGLQWRRVRSNLDNRAAFADTVSYLPRRIRLEVARAELLSLLIRPLYGDDPSFAVRELIQNAVDAVREREYIEQQYPRLAKPNLRKQPADVVVWLSDFDEEHDCAWLEVSDRGIGMTEEILTDYYLTAGASYRHSERWQQTFERRDLPPDATRPRAQVLRAGRFGVGVLATFLLGEAIDVETCHVSSSVGFRFTTSLTQDTVQIERVKDLPVGTRVRAKVSRLAFEKLGKDNSTVFKPGDWDWYVLNTPSVLRLTGNDKTEAKAGHTSFVLKEWRNAESDMPLTIHWRFPDVYHDGPGLSCNGIFVSRSARLPRIESKHCGSNTHTVRTPQLHIADADGILPLGLTRKEVVAEEYGFETDLYASIMKDYIARVLAQFPESCVPHRIKEILHESPIVELNTAPWKPDQEVPDCLLSEDGFCLPFSNALAACPRKVKHLLWLTQAESLTILPDLSSWDCVVLEMGLVFSPIRTRFLDNSAGVRIQNIRRTDTKTVEEQVNTDALSKEHSAATSPMMEEWVKWKLRVWDSVTGQHQNKGASQKTRWLMWSEGMDTSKYPFKSLLAKHKADPGRIPFVADVILANAWQEPIGPSLIDHVWQQFFGDAWIPWSKAARRARFPEAYRELAPYLRHYEKRAKR